MDDCLEMLVTHSMLELPSGADSLSSHLLTGTASGACKAYSCYDRTDFGRAGMGADAAAYCGCATGGTYFCLLSN